MMNWEKLISDKRFGLEQLHNIQYDNRTMFKRDYDRLVFSAPFRRLQNKTQVFPLPGSIFVHNRLTHSLEVASVGRSIGDGVARCIRERYGAETPRLIDEIGEIVSAACLAHDLGNPPFGHSGEKAIATFFSEGKGAKYRSLLSDEQWNDLTHYEGNANAFRLLTHRFKGRRKGGFVMTYSTLAAIVKYPYPSSLSGGKQKFGFFSSEAESFGKIADELGIEKQSVDGKTKYARHPLVYLVEAADDICYEIMDIEDAHKLKLLTNEETKEALLAYLDEKRCNRIREVWKEIDDINEQIVYLRSAVIGELIEQCVASFMRNEKSILNGTFKGSLIDDIAPKVRSAYEHCKALSKERIYNSKVVVDIELAGYKIISTLIELFVEAAMNPEKAYSKLLLNRVSSQYEVDADDTFTRIMAVLDFISGMTDVYALDLFRKINGESIPIV